MIEQAFNKILQDEKQITTIVNVKINKILFLKFF